MVNVQTVTHETYQILSSFFKNTIAWKSIGSNYNEIGTGFITRVFDSVTKANIDVDEINVPSNTPLLNFNVSPGKTSVEPGYTVYFFPVLQYTSLFLPGTRTVSIKKVGYYNLSESIDLLPGSIKKLEFNLKPISTKSLPNNSILPKRIFRLSLIMVF